MSASTDREDAREAMRQIARAGSHVEINQFLTDLRNDPTRTIRVLTAVLRCTFRSRDKLPEWIPLFNHIKTTFPELADDYLVGLSVD